MIDKNFVCSISAPVIFITIDLHLVKIVKLCLLAKVLSTNANVQIKFQSAVSRPAFYHLSVPAYPNGGCS